MSGEDKHKGLFSHTSGYFSAPYPYPPPHGFPPGGYPPPTGYPHPTHGYPHGHPHHPPSGYPPAYTPHGYPGASAGGCPPMIQWLTHGFHHKHGGPHHMFHHGKYKRGKFGKRWKHCKMGKFRRPWRRRWK